MENNKITMEMLSKKTNEAREFSEQCLKQIKEIVASSGDKEIDVDEMDGDYIYAVVGFDYETGEERITKLSIGSCGELVLETESGYTVNESDVCYREVVYPSMLEILMDMEEE